MTDLRPVIVFPSGTTTYEQVKLARECPGKFHVWGGTSEYAYALVELVDGKMVMVKHDGFKFTDAIALNFK